MTMMVERIERESFTHGVKVPPPPLIRLNIHLVFEESTGDLSRLNALCSDLSGFLCALVDDPTVR